MTVAHDEQVNVLQTNLSDQMAHGLNRRVRTFFRGQAAGVEKP